MRATVMHAAGDVRVENVPDPEIVQPTDAVVRVTRAAICGLQTSCVHGGFFGTTEVPGRRPRPFGFRSPTARSSSSRSPRTTR